MIPTSYKAKLPRHLTYPVGAEAVSETLAGAPHFERLSLHFSDCPVWPGTEFRRILQDRLPYKIMYLRFTPMQAAGFISSNAWVRDGYNDEKWEIWIYPVLAELRHLANGLLLEQGLPGVAGWLKSSNQGGWLSRPQQILLEFNSAERTLALQEFSGN